MEDDLVSWGRMLRLETRGRTSGRPAQAVLGFVERPDGSLIVSAGSPDANWALNLLDDAACRITIGGASWPAIARALEPEEHQVAVRDLILRYGTPSEGLGAGPSFEIRRGEP
ncbi:MAG TPA: nitroreductase family deazaflavin-dependent oxidoreductase [Candidatus Limnocylindrales bacterium]